MTPVRIAERANAQAFSNLVVSLAAAEAVRTVAAMSFTSTGEAQRVRDQLAADLDAAALIAADLAQDDQADLLDGLFRVMVRDVTQRGATLAESRMILLAEALPVEVLVQQLYGGGALSGTRTFSAALLDARCAEVVARNAIVHPGFLPAAVPLDVLTETGARYDG
jgi:prophage DNA circulation protein